MENTPYPAVIRRVGEKVIPADRGRRQSAFLVAFLGFALVAETAVNVFTLYGIGPFHRWFWISCSASACFAVLVLAVRAATRAAALLGALVCLNILFAQRRGITWHETALPALVTLFALTFAATRFGRARKEVMGLAEPKSGRRASQILANLGVAGLCAGMPTTVLFAAGLAALAEATADTVASEMGETLGGRTLLITGLIEVPAGTDGGVSVAGTLLGAAAAGVIALVTVVTDGCSAATGTIVFLAGVAGLIVDSYLGATLERRGLIGNDVVNFCSTLFAAGAAGLTVFLT